MHYGIDLGHGCPPDTGANGVRPEEELIELVGDRVISKLRSMGHSITECRPKKTSSVRNSLMQRVLIANSSKVDVFVSLHFNASNGRGHGAETFAISSLGKKIAARIQGEIVTLGFANRGVKDGSKFYVVKNTAMPAVLIEGCFCDNLTDMKLFDPEAMANAIVRGLTA
jgi:N-acetylmuramoyl-L-alanine amidase